MHLAVCDDNIADRKQTERLLGRQSDRIFKETGERIYIDSYGNVEAFMQRLQAIFADTDYRIVGQRELYFQNAVAVIFKMLGFNVQTERPANGGRMDMVVKTQTNIYVIEFKIDKSADAALQQIKDKGYCLPFVADPRPKVLIGVNFSSETRGISEWKSETANTA